MKPWRPTRAQIEAARDTTISDVIADGLDILFVGINPSLYSAAVGRHFARPGNRFWPALHRGGITPRQLSPFEDHLLVEYGAGLTNIAARATARADELEAGELLEGAKALVRKIRKRRPRVVAIVGVTAYRAAFGKPKAQIGEQLEKVGGARVWALPNPSGLNAHYQLPELAKLYRKMARSAGR